MSLPDVTTPVKVFTIFFLWLLSLLFSAMPFLVASKVKNTIVLFSALNCLSGGVVLGAALSHMLPDANVNFNAFWGSFAPGSISPKLASYPFPPLIAATGLILLMIIDRTALGDHSHSEVAEDPDTVHKHQQHQHKKDATQTNTHAVNPSERSPLIQSAKVDLGYNTESLNKEVTYYQSHASQKLIGNKSAAAKATLFLAALSVHSFLEGLGIGAEDQKHTFYSVLLAVVAHKCLEAFALGLSVFYGSFSKRITMFLLIGYSIATPVGVAIGLLIAQLSTAQNLVAGCLVSLAAGSFLYISLIEILPTELHKPRALKKKLLCMTVGWLGMACIAYFT